MEIQQLLESLSTQFHHKSNLEYGEKMSAYMKGKFVYHGIASPVRNVIQKEWFA